MDRQTINGSASNSMHESSSMAGDTPFPSTNALVAAAFILLALSMALGVVTLGAIAGAVTGAGSADDLAGWGWTCAGLFLAACTAAAWALARHVRTRLRQRSRPGKP